MTEKILGMTGKSSRNVYCVILNEVKNPLLLSTNKILRYTQNDNAVEILRYTQNDKEER